NFAKLGSGKIEFRPRPVAIRHTLDAVIEMVAPQLAQKQLTLVRPAAPNDLSVHADEDRARQILLNLFANALKFTPTGGKITVDVIAEPTVVLIGVSDTGIGIP